MTNYQAVKADLLRYTVSKIAIEKALILAGLDPIKEFALVDQAKVAKIVVKLLRGCVTIKSESDGGSSQSFGDSGDLIAYIRSYASENDLDYMVRDLSTGDFINDCSDRW